MVAYTTRIDGRLRGLAAPGMLALTLLIPLAAYAGSPAEVVFVGGPDDAATRQQVTDWLGMLSPPVAIDGEPVHLGRLAPPESLMAFGAGSTETCDGSPVDGAAYRERLAALYRDIVSLQETPTLLQQTGQIERMHACLTEPVTRNELARVHFLEGVIATSDGDGETADRAFSEVFGLDPEFPWDPDYPPSTHDRFRVMRAAADGQDRVELRLLVADGATAWLDGQELAPSGAAVRIIPGRHVVQVRGPGEARCRSMALVARPDAEVLVIDAGALPGDAVPPEPGQLTHLSLLFDALGTDPGGSPRAFVACGPEPAIWSWDAGAGSLQSVELPPAVAALSGDAGPPVGPGRPGPGPAAPILAIGGAVVAAAGAVVTGVAWSQVQQFNDGVAAGELAPYPQPDDPDPDSYELYAEFQRKRSAVYTGYALIAAGGAMCIISIPVGVASARRDRQLTLTLGLQPRFDLPSAAARPAVDATLVLTLF